MSIGPPRLASTVARFAYPVTRYRYIASTVNDDGLSVDPWPEADTVQAHVWPARARDIASLPEGQVTSGLVAGSTSADLTPASTETQTRGDVIVWNGDEYEVIQIDPYAGGSTGALEWRSFVARRITREVEP